MVFDEIFQRARSQNTCDLFRWAVSEHLENHPPDVFGIGVKVVQSCDGRWQLFIRIVIVGLLGFNVCQRPRPYVPGWERHSIDPSRQMIDGGQAMALSESEKFAKSHSFMPSARERFSILCLIGAGKRFQFERISHHPPTRINGAIDRNDRVVGVELEHVSIRDRKGSREHREKAPKLGAGTVWKSGPPSPALTHPMCIRSRQAMTKENRSQCDRRKNKQGYGSHHVSHHSASLLANLC